MGRVILIVVMLVLASLGVVYLLGPTTPTEATVAFRDSDIGPDPVAYLAEHEAAIPNIRPGLAKEIVWDDPVTKARTPLSVVYIHGFSASKGEVRPLPEKVGDALGANLFFTRLAGHGADEAAMGEATLDEWADDTAEALAIGRAIGEKVILIGTSTGGSLAAWALTQSDLARDVAAIVLISPNFGVQAGGAGLLTGPWGQTLAEFIVGKERGFEPATDLQRRYWTYRYPTKATLPMAAAVALARRQAYDRVMVPALFVYSEQDKVIKPSEVKAVAAAWGGPCELIPVSDPGDPSSHVLAGDAYSPRMTDPLAARIVAWLASLEITP